MMPVGSIHVAANKRDKGPVSHAPRCAKPLHSDHRGSRLPPASADTAVAGKPRLTGQPGSINVSPFPNVNIVPSVMTSAPFNRRITFRPGILAKGSSLVLASIHVVCSTTVMRRPREVVTSMFRVLMGRGYAGLLATAMAAINQSGMPSQAAACRLPHVIGIAGELRRLPAVW